MIARRRPSFVFWLVCFVLVVVSLPARPAAADPTPADKSQGAVLKKRADEAMESLRYASALEDYSEAYRLTGDTSLLYNRARVLEALERFGEALDELERFSREATPQLRSRVPRLKELVNDLSARVATLTVNCTTPGARVLVREKVVGTTPLDGPVRMNAGTAEVEVVAEGYVPFKQTIDLPKAGAITLDVFLVAREARGQLVVRSTPEGADVRIDGKSLGRAPTEAQLAPGNHVIVVSRDGFVDKKASAVVIEGQSKTVDVTLERPPPITSKWWFWTGIGVVVVGVAVVSVVYALTTEKDAGRGDIAPGQVSGPLRF